MNKPLNKLNHFQKPIIGIGVTAFVRTNPAFFLPNYSIISLLKTKDINSIKKACPVHNLQGDYQINPNNLKQNTANILKMAETQYIIKKIKPSGIIVYKSSKNIEKIAQKLSTKILSTPAKIRDKFEDKKKFRLLAKKAGLNLIPGQNYKIKNINTEQIKKLIKKHKSKITLQLTDYKTGGGKGTFFIENINDWKKFKKFVKKEEKNGKKLQSVNITKFINGKSVSINACVTKHGILSTRIQSQLIGIKETVSKKRKQGSWCGHDWSLNNFNNNIQKQAENIAKTLGKFMAKKGYKGVFGIDLIIEKDTDKVWPVECNPRFTGAFPAYSMIQDLSGEIPIDAFHVLEFLKINYKVNFNKIQKNYKKPKKGAQLILTNKKDNKVKIINSPKAGIYKFDKNIISWQRPGFNIQQLKNKNEFCLTDRIPVSGTILKPNQRLARILFKKQIAATSNKLTAETTEICKKIYKKYRFKTITS